MEGTVELREVRVGSKSDGVYAWLRRPGEEADLCLYRPGEYPADDPGLVPLAGRTVCVEGEVQPGGWLMVDKIDDGNTENERKYDETMPEM
jgi:hypothetical protein